MSLLAVHFICNYVMIKIIRSTISICNKSLGPAEKQNIGISPHSHDDGYDTHKPTHFFKKNSWTKKQNRPLK